MDLLKLQQTLSLKDGIGHGNALPHDAHEGGVGGGGEHQRVGDGTGEGEKKEGEPCNTDEAEEGSSRSTTGTGTGTSLSTPPPGLHTDANFWKNYFNLAPATTETRRRPTMSTSASRSGLDYFAY